MWICIGLCVLGLVVVLGLYSALVVASREDDTMEEYFDKQKEAIMKELEEVEE